MAGYRISTPVLALMSDAAYQHQIHPALIFAALNEEDFGNYLSQNHAAWLSSALQNYPDLVEIRKQRQAEDGLDYAGGDAESWLLKIINGLDMDYQNQLSRDSSGNILLSSADVSRARFNLSRKGSPEGARPSYLTDDDEWAWEEYLLEKVGDTDLGQQSINFTTLKYPTTI